MVEGHFLFGKITVDKRRGCGYNIQAFKFHMRECWNGRQARLRCVCLWRVGSSPISRTKQYRYPFGYLYCFMWTGREPKVRSVSAQEHKLSACNWLARTMVGAKRQPVPSPAPNNAGSLWGICIIFVWAGQERLAGAQRGYATVRWTVA